jgi:hypothetical protein
VTAPRASRRAAVWLNEYHADFLAHDRMAEAEARAARREMIAAACGREHRIHTTLGAWIVRLARWVRAACPAGAAASEHGHGRRV